MHNTNLTKSRGIVWFRSDLRLLDNQALTDAAAVCDEILPVFVFDERLFEQQTRYGFDKIALPRRRFLMQCVLTLQASLRERGSDLFVAYGKTEDILLSLAHQYRTSWVFCNRERTQEEVQIQDAVERNLWSIGQEMRYSRGKMLLHTGDLPFPVTHTPDRFTIFKKEVAYLPIREPLAIPAAWQTFKVDQLPLDLPSVLKVTECQAAGPIGGEDEAQQHLYDFISELDTMTADRCSILSPWISHGCLSVKQFYHELKSATKRNQQSVVDGLISRLLHRDYFRFMGKKYGDRIFYSSGVQERKKPLPVDSEVASCWAEGRTDVPIINAAMHALVNTGWLSYRMRALCAAYFVQELKQDWRYGAEFFESHLIDYDPCSNYGNWNQIAGVGPEERDDIYANIDNQSRIIDPAGEFIKKWG